MNISKELFSKIKQLSYRRRFYTTLEDDPKIEYLKQTFLPFNRPNHYEFLLSRNKEFSKFKRSSVLVPISTRLEKNAQGHYVQKSFFTLTKRTDLVNSFKGQVCFVGGMRDSTDANDAETALREAKEEIGIEPDQVTFLAQLCPILTTRGNLITPIVAYFNDMMFMPDLSKHEVDFVFELPTDRFIKNERYKSESFKRNKDVFTVHYFEDVVNGKQVTTWGATALMCTFISSVLHSRIPQFELDQQDPLTNENIYDFLDNYLKKSARNYFEHHSKFIY
ncbi:peroxisomal coenzyme A diphosphatase NUDT7 isoform X2 [Brachionus plicatilis]|uniref:Peroxisomal coenzyme A diphosphatase NUDT7 isoform X2 n=1 Tax=Brachionus plicatilis TaxID=10195 RepID=A0A3M7Q396_BRAPC|nr:peroxisomal coenzyme A diphosphatase NUDT7 isoform X2 [Brachionus plicatilis]